MLYEVGNTTISLEIPALIALPILQAQIPSIEVSRKISSVPDITIRFEDSNNESFIIKENNFLLSGEWSNSLQTDMPHLMYSILRQYWLEHGYYCVHSVVINNSLLIGHSGMGKTTLALKAIKKEMDLFSFDKTILKFNDTALHAVFGTQIISVREKYLSRAQNVLKDDYLIKNGERFIFNSDTGKPREIKNIFLFSLSENNLEIESASIHQLYAYFMDSVKIDALMGNFLFSGNSSLKAKGHLIVGLKNMSPGIKTLIGTPVEIITHIQKL